MKYLNIEGLDGAGKTTVIEYLKKKFRVIRFKTKPILNPLEALEKEIYISNKVLKLSQKFQQSNILLIRDRGFLTTIVYNSILSPETSKKVSYEQLLYLIKKSAVLPSIIFLDADIKTVLQRKRCEYSKEKLLQLRELYYLSIRVLQKFTKVNTVDANQPLLTVFKNVESIIKKEESI